MPGAAHSLEPAHARVLIVDDEPMILNSVSAFLELEGYGQVRCFERGEPALLHLERSGADVIVSDFLMPELDGVEVLRRARAIDPLVPRILLSGCTERERAERAIQAAAVFQYLEKPWCNNQLCATLRDALERRRLLCELSATPESQDPGCAIERVRRRLLRAFLCGG